MYLCIHLFLSLCIYVSMYRSIYLYLSIYIYPSRFQISGFGVSGFRFQTSGFRAENLCVARVRVGLSAVAACGRGRVALLGVGVRVRALRGRGLLLRGREGVRERVGGRGCEGEGVRVRV